MFQNSGPDWCYFHRAAGAFKNCHAQFFFQFLDLTTQGRLTDETAFRRLAEVAGFGYRNDVFQVT